MLSMLLIFCELAAAGILFVVVRKLLHLLFISRYDIEELKSDEINIVHGMSGDQTGRVKDSTRLNTDAIRHL